MPLFCITQVPSVFWFNRETWEPTPKWPSCSGPSSGLCRGRLLVQLPVSGPSLRLCRGGIPGIFLYGGLSSLLSPVVRQRCIPFPPFLRGGRPERLQDHGTRILYAPSGLCTTFGSPLRGNTRQHKIHGGHISAFNLLWAPHVIPYCRPD